MGIRKEIFCRKSGRALYGKNVPPRIAAEIEYREINGFPLKKTKV